MGWTIANQVMKWNVGRKTSTSISLDVGEEGIVGWLKVQRTLQKARQRAAESLSQTNPKAEHAEQAQVINVHRFRRSTESRTRFRCLDLDPASAAVLLAQPS